MSDLAGKTCSPRHGGALDRAQAEALGKEVPEWSLGADAKEIRRTFSFKNYYPTMAFVNAATQVAHQQDHHPDMTVGYNKVTVVFSTHSVGGLSENDFICAAKLDALGSLA